ncbi:hypothetical protein [uncultured Aquimarina sp.]|uniref:hypothetical protein n=1 Tax=uncultured Aquimarina sp. TaxID=575652 RepID=UPI00261214F8|nr:hypothetical protein [uncultured Aquimarina sp.]
MKIKYILILIISLISLSLTELELERKEILNGDLTMLIPKDFIRVSKEDYIPEYAGVPKPDDYFKNKEKSIEISFMRIPKQSENLQWCKTFSQSAFRGNDSKFYFNDTISINNIKMHLTEFDATFVLW